MTEKLKPADTKYDNSSEYVTFVVHTAKYRTLPTKMYNNRKQWVKRDPNQIVSDIPGTIHKIYVKKGQKVKKGELLIEHDAMKMYNKILAPFNCKIKNILVAENEKVSKNVLLLELE